MAEGNPKSEIRNPKSKRLVPLLLNWFSANARDLPWRRTRDPYAIWVSEIMLQQTQVKTVIPYWKRWMRELPSIRSVANASPDKIHKLWEGLGYYTRARNLQRAAQQIVARQVAISKSRRSRGLSRRSETQTDNETQIRRKLETPHVVSYKFPDEFDDVLALPGIGRYTAGAICSIAFNQPTPILDGNVVRVLTRIFGIGENPREKTTNAQLWRLAEELVRHSSLVTRHSSLACSHLNQSLMELGALICTPQNPQCRICPVRKQCVALSEGRVAELPNLGKRNPPTARHFVAFVVERNGRFLVRQRPAGVLNAHLWEFPNLEIGARLSEPQHGRMQNINGEFPVTNELRTRCGSGDPRSESVASVADRLLGSTPAKLSPLCTIKHSITRYRITLEAFIVRLNDSAAKAGGFWKTPTRLRQLAFSAAHKKVLNKLS